MSDGDEIAAFIARRGVTRCPPAYAAETPNAVLNREPGTPFRWLKGEKLGGKNYRSLKRIRRRWVHPGLTSR